MKKRKASKREYGEGSIYCSNGRWYFAIRLGSGKRQVTRCTSEQDAKDLQSDSLRRLRSGGQLAHSKGHTLTSYLYEWLEVSHDGFASSTRTLYKGFIDKHIAQDIGNQRLTDITTPMLQIFFRRIGKTLKPGSVIRLRGMLRSALSSAVDWGLIYENPATKTRPPKNKDVAEIRPLTKEQANALLEVVSGHRLELLYRMALTLGMREGELLGLRWIDIDFKHSRILIRSSLNHSKEGKEPTKWYLGAVKTKKSKRVLDLTPGLLLELKHHQRDQERERREDEAMVSNGLVFDTETGTPVQPSNLRRHFHNCLAKAKIERIRFHDLRHTFATLSLMAGVPLKTVSEILGHSTITITADIYGHVYPENKKDALILVDGLLNNSLDISEQV
jgi:integrase